jgi:hypothetical protein
MSISNHIFLRDEATAIGDLLKKPVQLGDEFTQRGARYKNR